jgi:hypothetical protein
MKTNIHRTFFCLILFMCICYLNTAIAQAVVTNIIDTTKNEEQKIEVNVEVNYMKHYLWRSLLFGNDDVCQPAIGITYKKWSLNLSSNINYVPKNVPKESYTKPVAFDEQDIEILYADKIGKLDFEIKADMYIYFYQINSPSTAELNVKVSYPIYKNITAFSENVVDMYAYNGAYYNNTGLVWDFTKHKTDFSLEASVGAGNVAFNQTYFGGETSGIFYWGSKVEITQHFKNLYARITGEYNLYNKEEIKAVSEINNTSNFAFTIGKDFSFPIRTKRK